jgi:hypothetical protein
VSTNSEKLKILFVPYEKIPCLALKKKFTQNKTIPSPRKNLPVTEFSPFHFFAVFVVNKMGPSKNRIKLLLSRNYVATTLGSQREDALNHQHGAEL